LIGCSYLVEREGLIAAARVTQFPAGLLRDSALQNLVQLWASRAPAQAGEWLNGLDQGPARHLAVQTYATQVAPFFFASAAQWAATIGDEAARAKWRPSARPG
jgi:hypothetical protein